MASLSSFPPAPVLLQAPRHTATAHAVLITLALAAGTVATGVQAQPASPAARSAVPAAAQHFQIPAGPLGAALAAFAADAGVTISAAPALVQGRHTQGLSGTYAVGEGLARLLAGSDLQAQPAGEDSYVLRALPVVTPGTATGQGATLGEVKVTAAAVSEGMTEKTGSYTTQSMRAATGLPLALRETPQSVSVITRQRIDDQRLETLDDALKATTGMTSTYNGSERALWYSRGERVETLQVDGLPMSIADGFSTDSLSLPATVLYDHVEVVRGANGLLQGSGSPSAAINLVRKRPSKQRQGELSLSYGSWANRTIQLDAGGPLNEAGTLRARGVAYANQANSFRDTGSKSNKLLSGIVEADLSPDTMLMAGLVWQDDHTGGYDWGGLPTRIDGTFYPFSPSTSLTPAWAYLDKRNRQLFTELTHRFNADWKLTLAASHISAKAGMLGRSTRHLNTNDAQLQMRATALDYDDTRKNLGLQLQGGYQLGGRRHELTLGVNYQNSDWFYSSASVGAYHLLNPLQFDPNSIPYPSSVVNSRSHEGSSKKETGIYVATRLDLPASNKLIVGGRLSWVDYASYNSWSNAAASYKASGEFTPYVGLVHELNESTSLYASYTEVFKPQSNLNVHGGMLPPVIGSNYELGIKNEFFDGALQTAMAVFQTDQTHLPKAVGGQAACFSPAVTCYEPADKVRNRGFEVDVSGELARGWQVAAGYTYNQSRYLSGGDSGTLYNTYLPRRMLKLSTSWRLPDTLSAWKLGASLQAQSGVAVDPNTTGYQSYNYGSPPYRIAQKGYALLGLMAAYQVSKDTEMQLNVSNALNKRYYATIGGNNWGNFMGAPRSATLTLRTRF